MYFGVKCHVYIAHSFLSAVSQGSSTLDIPLIKPLPLLFYCPQIFLSLCPACSHCFKECSFSLPHCFLPVCTASIFQLGKEWQTTLNNNPRSVGCRCANKELLFVSLTCRYLLQDKIVFKHYCINPAALDSYLGLATCVLSVLQDKQGIPWWLGISYKGIGQYDLQDKVKPRKVSLSVCVFCNT